MPLGPGIRYRWKKTKHGKVRLAFRGNQVIETKKEGGTAKMVHDVIRRRAAGKR